MMKIPVCVTANYKIECRFGEDLGGWGSFVDRDYRILDLNDGGKAIIVDSKPERWIIFGYDNVFYNMFTKASIDEAVQILENLGIVAE